ncbi:tyrosine--tRNA ligase [soil metagenome]
MKLTFTEHDCFEHLVAQHVGLELVRERASHGEKLRVKLGIDPTSPDLHLGRTLPLWRLRAFQELGHEVHLIIGSFTALVGDTSDKESERPMLTSDQVKANIAHYEEQLWRVLNPEKKDLVHIHYNHEWLEKLSFAELITLADAFSVNQFVKRELIAKRLESGSRVSLRELFYPIMQGYDSIEVKADIELGGTDQWFNLLAGRVLQEQRGMVPQAIITGELITDADGKKMSSSQGNGITLNQEPFAFYTAIMQVPDTDMPMLLRCLPASAQPWTADELAQKLQSGENPRDSKLALAARFIELFWGEEASAAAVSQWERETLQRSVPQDVPTYQLSEDCSALHVLVTAGLAPSNGEARRLIEQGGVRLDGVTITTPQHILTPGLLQVGKHRFLQLES